MRTAIGWVKVSASLAVAFVMFAGCESGELEGPAAEVTENSDIKLDLPAVPEFTTPKPNADGTHSVAEMRLKGGKFMDSEVKVKGYIVWAYDCATAMRKPNMTDKELAKQLEEHPEQCERPNVFLGDSKDTARAKGVWVVEIPRPPREDEKKNLPKDQLEAWPEVPVYNLGDEVIVTGKWARRSPKGFSNTDGLLVYSALENLTTPAEPPK